MDTAKVWSIVAAAFGLAFCTAAYALDLSASMYALGAFFVIAGLVSLIRRDS